MTASLEKNLLKFNQFSFQFPGGSDLNLNGALSNFDTTPKFIGKVNLKTNNFQQVQKWLNITKFETPKNRLREMRLKSELIINRDNVKFQNLFLDFDRSRVMGAVTIATKKRRSFSANLILDQINIDSYNKKSKVLKSNLKGKTISPSSAQIPDSGFSTFNYFFLDNFDAAIKVNIKNLIYKMPLLTFFYVNGTSLS